MSRRKASIEASATQAESVAVAEPEAESRGNWKVTFNTRYSPWLPLTVIVHGVGSEEEVRQELFSLIDRAIVQVERTR